MQIQLLWWNCICTCLPVLLDLNTYIGATFFQQSATIDVQELHPSMFLQHISQGYDTLSLHSSIHRSRAAPSQKSTVTLTQAQIKS